MSNKNLESFESLMAGQEEVTFNGNKFSLSVPDPDVIREARAILTKAGMDERAGNTDGNPVEAQDRAYSMALASALGEGFDVDMALRLFTLSGGADGDIGKAVGRLIGFDVERLREINAEGAADVPS